MFSILMEASMVEKRQVSRIEPDAMALRALAHPQRLKMLGLLRLEGPATATALADRLGLNSGAASYHLRQLARHGFIEDDSERGNARERWWRAAHESTSIPPAAEDDDTADARMAFAQAALGWQIAEMQRAVEMQPELSPEWRKASTLSDYSIPLSASDAAALVDKLNAVLLEAMASAPRLGDDYPDGVQPVTVILHAFPRQPEGGK
jgi:DNA-binding transcriptional ArsR family regulator